MEKDTIALVGAGIGGRAILLTLLKIPGVEIKYVCDIDPQAPGIDVAKNNNIQCCFENWPEIIASDQNIDLILEVTGNPKVLQKLNELKPDNTILVAAAGTKVIFHLLETQFNVAQRLREYKRNLEERIIERTEEIEHANRELEMKILEYEDLNEKLQKVNDEKTRYLLQSTHQLKAPFAAIQSYTDIILEGYTGDIPKQTKDIVEKIKLRCERLSQSIKEMLALANLKSCIKDNLVMTHISLGEIINHVIEDCYVITSSRNIIINYENCCENDCIKCNQDQITILFSTLIENAIIYSDDDSTIEVSVAPLSDDMISVVVKDHGIGIPEKNVSKIFNEYFRSNNAVKFYEDGTGLGLAIAKEIITIHNASVEVKSSPGEGSVFTINFPVTR